MNKQPPIAIVLAILHAILCHFLVFLTSLASHFFVFYKLFSSMMDDGILSPTLILLFSAIVYLFAFFLFTRAFALYHKPFRQSYPICRRNATVPFKEKLRLLFKDSSFLTSLAVTVASTVFLPYTSIGKYLAEIAFGNSYSYGGIILMTVAPLPLLLALFIFAYLGAARSIRNEGIRERQEHTETPIRSLVWEVINLVLAIVSASILIPLLIVMASQFLIFLVFIPTIIIAILAFIVLRYVRAIRIRKKFLHSLKETCQRNNYTLSKIQKPFRSLFFITDGISFSVQNPSGKQHDCKLLHSIKRTSPMFFHSDGIATLVSPITFFRTEIAYRVKSTPYSFESENNKCVIVCPIPRAFYARNESSQSDVDSSVTEAKFFVLGFPTSALKSGGMYEMGLPKNTRSRELDIGDSFNGYKFYNATGFLNAIEHNVFDR